MINCKITQLFVQLLAKNFVACEWHPSMREVHFDSEAAEDYEEDPSAQQRMTLKKQVLQLKECLEVFTSVERLGADDAWYNLKLFHSIISSMSCHQS